MEHKQLMKMPRLVTAALVAAVGLLGVVPLAGCGGARHAASLTNGPTRSGKLEFTIAWPKSSRLIPSATQSLRFELQKKVNGNWVLVSPLVDGTANPKFANKPQTTVVFSNLEVGPDANPEDYQITITAHPDINGGGTPLALGVGHASLSFSNPVPAGGNLKVTLFSTIVRVEVTPKTGSALRVGKTRDFTATAYDGDGAIVLVDPAKYSWALSNGSVGTLSSTTGTSVTFTATTPGTTNLTVAETESGFSNTIDPAIINVADVGLADSSWAKSRADLRNTGQVSGAVGGVADTGTILAEYVTGGRVLLSSPAVSSPDPTTGDFSLFTGSQDNFIYAIDGRSMGLLWRFETDGTVDSSPALARNGIVYAGSNDGRVYALDAEDGTSVWAANKGILSGPVSSSPAIGPDGAIYVGTAEPGKDFYKLDPLTGNVVWKVTVGGGIVNTAAFSPDGTKVYFGCRDGKVYALDTNSGATAAGAWPVATGGDIFNSSPAIDEAGTIYIGSSDNKVYALNPNGTSKWAAPVNVGAPIFSSVAIASTGGVATRIYVGTFDIVSGDNLSKMTALDPATGAVVWQYPSDPAQGVGLITSSPAIGGDGTVYFGAWDGTVYALNPDGSLRWEVDTLDIVESSPAIAADGTLYVGNQSGRIFAIR